MKKVFLILATAFLFACSPSDKKQYRVEVVYSNGEKEILTYQGIGDNYFTLDHGDLKEAFVKKTLVSGVRSFKILSIIKMGPLKDGEPCNCTLTLTQKEKAE